ncbi:MLV-related proviral Env polyprotein-like [Prinia subflava]|uniref:MLV-related proviral Env polyprotein-like n=1 Tax=Prinia subflava TaxID=208062 RepID=UPI002FE389AC
MVLVTVLMLFLWVMLISWILMSPVGIAVTLGYGIQKGQLTTLHSRMKREIQATTKMTLQNRLALDMLLLKEHGVCGYLKGQIDHCCIHIPNVTADVEHDISQLKQIEHEAQKEQKDLATSWLGKIFEGLGWNVSSWIKSILENLIILLIIFLVIWLVYRILKREIQKKASWNRTIMKALARNPAPSIRNNIPDKAYDNRGFEDEHPV